MNLDDFKEAWKCQNTTEFAKMDPDELVQQLRAEQRVIKRVLLFSDIFVATIYISVLGYIWNSQSGMETNWPRHLAAVFILIAAAYHPWRNWNRKKNEQPSGDALRDELKKKSDQLDYQIRFSRWGSIWGYYLPTVTGLSLFYVQWYINGTLGLVGIQLAILSNTIILGLLGYFAGGMGIRGAKKRKREVDQELEALGCPVEEKEIPMSHRIARIALFVVTFALCVYMAVAALSDRPRTGSPMEPAPTFDQLGSFDEQEARQIDEWLAEVRAAGDYPSLMVAIVGDGRVLYQSAVGYADIETQREATPETLWHVASATKAFTGALAAKLHEKSVIDLDRLVVDYLPDGVAISEEPERGAKITVRQLASHTSGLPRGVPGDVQSVNDRYALEPERLYKHLAKVELESDPGTKERYSNLGMGLLGHVLERAARVPFDQLLKDEILDPLGMNQSGITIADEHIDRLAKGYGRERPREWTTHPYRSRLAASGGLVTSVSDLSKFLLAQMPENPQPTDALTPTMLANLHTPTKFSDGSDADTALGWSVENSRAIGRYLEKNGGRNNAKAWIGFSPEHRVGVAVIANCGDASTDEIGYWLLERTVPNVDPDKLDRTPVSAKLAPFDGVRWESDEDDTPTVRVDGEWMELVSVEGVDIEQIMKAARENYRSMAHMRFAEDFVEVLAVAGLRPDWTVTLELLREGENEPIRMEVAMTEKNRDKMRDARLEKLDSAK